MAPVWGNGEGRASAGLAVQLSRCEVAVGLVYKNSDDEKKCSDVKDT